MVTDRGQAYTLEAIIAAVLLVSSLVFALQVTAVTPLSASTSNQHIENQQRASASGVLTAAQEAGVLKDAVLFWDDTEAEFYDAERVTFYTNSYPPNDFGDITQRAFDGRGLAVNVVVHPGNADPVEMVYRGEPSDNAVSASRTVTIYKDDELTAPGISTTAENADTYEDVIPPDSDGNSVYNVVRVEVTVWRM
ncbi:DUF7288 family protein [Natronomonas marina]|jgi:hypothetical protein|uniref:DUF7288 family protein n=1 Tax=Natronomonas marina TaxID=2961939 RepID=UPI0020C97915|nr:hypothetical protein [Natronomonas marina]